MRLTANIYQTSGILYGTNSNTYCVDTAKGLVMIDAGFSENQYNIIRRKLEEDGLGKKKVLDVFLTHAHYDHSGNAWLFKQGGANVYLSEKDREAVISEDERVLSDLFGRKFHGFTPDLPVVDNQVFDYGDTRLTVLSHAGHTEGTISLLVETHGIRALFTGDIFVLNNCTPSDELQAEIGWTGGPDFNQEKNIDTFLKLREMPEVDLVAPGHGSVFFGDSKKLFGILYKLATKETT